MHALERVKGTFERDQKIQDTLALFAQLHSGYPMKTRKPKVFFTACAVVPLLHPPRGLGPAFVRIVDLLQDRNAL